jgi:hypothetical protein
MVFSFFAKKYPIIDTIYPTIANKRNIPARSGTNNIIPPTIAAKMRPSVNL